MMKRGGDVFGDGEGIFGWLRDKAYEFLYYDVGTFVDFVGDLFRGPSGYSQSLHRQTEKAEARSKPEAPLTTSERQVFVDMLKRTPDEPQMAYWKRKKALLNTPDKKELVHQQMALLKDRETRQRGNIHVDAVTGESVRQDRLRTLRDQEKQTHDRGRTL